MCVMMYVSSECHMEFVFLSMFRAALVKMYNRVSKMHKDLFGTNIMGMLRAIVKMLFVS